MSMEGWEEMNDIMAMIKGKKSEVRQLESKYRKKWGEALDMPEATTPAMPKNPAKDYSKRV